MDDKIDKFILFEKNEKDDTFLCEKLAYEEKYYYLKFFSAAICNYDLKEEVFDYMANDSIKALQYFKTEDDLVRNLSNNDIMKIKMNSFCEECIEHFEDCINVE